MMKKTIILFLLTLFSLVLKSQTHSICSNNRHSQISLLPISEGFENNKEVIQFIEKLLKTVELPMNFQIRQCNSKFCSNNAFAAMDKNGTRYIVYDNEWFNKIDLDSTNNVSLTILAHELGHHFSGHTLSLNEAKHKTSIDFCDKNSKLYDISKCTGDTLIDYSQYLRVSRKHELQADRFAGYIMSKFGLDLEAIKKSYSSVMTDYDDSNSTHPTLSKRLKALNEGAKLANSKRKNIDLFDIKGNPTTIKVKDESIKATIAKQKETIRLVENLAKHIAVNPVKKLNEINEFRIGTTSSSRSNSQEAYSRMRIYLNKPKYNGGKQHYKNGEIFEHFNSPIALTYNTNILFHCHSAYHVKDGVLRVILFNEEKPKIIYKSSSDFKDISFKEIELLMIEVYDNGLSNAILEFENKN